MGTIKFEIELPEFNKELNISLTIRKDGEVIYTTSSSSTDSGSELKKESNDFTNDTIQKNITGESSMNSFNKSQGIIEKATKSPEPSSTTKRKRISGNMMDMDI